VSATSLSFFQVIKYYLDLVSLNSFWNSFDISQSTPHKPLIANFDSTILGFFFVTLSFPLFWSKGNVGEEGGRGGGSEDFAGFFAVEYFLWFFRRSFKIRYDSQ